MGKYIQYFQQRMVLCLKSPVVLNQDMAIAATTVAMTEAHDVNYTLKITQDTSKFTPKPEEKADYTAVDAALAKVPSDLSIYTARNCKSSHRCSCSSSARLWKVQTG